VRRQAALSLFIRRPMSMKRVCRVPFVLSAPLLCALVLVCPVLRAAESEDLAAAPPGEKLVVVNNETITRKDLTSYMNLYYSMPERLKRLRDVPVQLQETARKQIRDTALQELIERKLLVSRARNTFLDDENAEEALDHIIRQYIQSLERRLDSALKLREELARRGLSLQEFKQLKKEEWLAQEVKRREVESRIHVSPWQIRRYYEGHTDQFFDEGRLVFRQMWLNPKEYESRTEELARQLAAQLQEGADFAAMADRYSYDRDFQPGGLHKLVPQNPPAQWLADILDDLKRGEVSGPHKREEGWYIVKLEERIEPHARPLSEVQDEIRSLLEKEEKERGVRELLERLRGGARIRHYSQDRLSSG